MIKLEELVKRVTTHFNPKSSPIIKCREFNMCEQKDGKIVTEFIAVILKIPEHCEYGDTLNDMLRDRLVCGVFGKYVQI